MQYNLIIKFYIRILVKYKIKYYDLREKKTEVF